MKKYSLGFLSGAITTWIACAVLGWRVLRKALKTEREESVWASVPKDAETAEEKLW